MLPYLHDRRRVANHLGVDRYRAGILTVRVHHHRLKGAERPLLRHQFAPEFKIAFPYGFANFILDATILFSILVIQRGRGI